MEVAFAQVIRNMGSLVDCILGPRKTIVDLDDAIKAFEIIEAADRSAASGGQPVKLPLGW